MANPPNPTAVEVKDPGAFGFKIGIGIVLALVAIAGFILFAGTALTVLGIAASSAPASTESTVSTESTDTSFETIESIVSSNGQLSEAQMAQISDWRDRTMKAQGKHWSPYFPTEEVRQKRLDLPALVVGSVYHVQGHVETNDTMHADPEGDRERRWSVENSDFQVLALEKSNGLLYYKVRVWLSSGETADRYAAASQFYYLKPTRVTRAELQRVGQN